MYVGAGVKNHRHITASPHLLPTQGLRGSVRTAAKSVARPCVSSSARRCENFRGGFVAARQFLASRMSSLSLPQRGLFDDHENSFDYKSKSAMFDDIAIEMKVFHRSRRSDRRESPVGLKSLA